MPRPYRSFSGSLIDPEKQRLSYDEDDVDSIPSLVSSRSTSASHTPMLRHHLTAHNGHWTRPFTQRRFTRYFTLAISSSLLLFIFFLVNASWSSQAEVQAGVTLKPTPPEWEHFPTLQRYFGGIRSLLDKEANDVEYPLTGDEETKRLEELAMHAKTNEEIRASQKRQDWQSRARRFDPFHDKQNKPVSCSKFVNNNTKVPQILAYMGKPRGFPNPVIGSYDVLGLADNVCFDRYGRLGPYGYGYSRVYGGSSAGMDGDTDGKDLVWEGQPEVDYRTVNWADAQDDCLDANSHRFRTFHATQDPTHWTDLKARDSDLPVNRFEQSQEPSTSTPSSTDAASRFAQDANPEHPPDFPSGMAVPPPQSQRQSSGAANSQTEGAASQPQAPEQASAPKIERRLLPRTAVLIRTWDSYEYDDEDMFNLRSIINELSLQSGGEYEIHFLVHMKNESQSVWADESEYKRVLRAALPDEFSGMGTLWSERQMALLYGGLDETLWHGLAVHSVYRSAFMPVQYFSHMHPEYDFIWNWEMDIRYTGHFYHLFDQAANWARQQPRKGLWERNGRFYVPSQHGSYEDFRQMVRVQTEHGTAAKASMYKPHTADAAAPDNAAHAETSVWGAIKPGDDALDHSHDPVPATSYDFDKYVWGVDEDADLITFNPIFDPQGTSWIIANDVIGYNTTTAEVPRRASIGTGIRLSRRLLQTMHRETAVHRHTMSTEMWPASCALQHGFKAVYVPHPVYIDRAWPTSYLAAIFNNGHNGAAGGAQTSIFSDKRQHNFKGTTWYYDAVFGGKLWQRWLGYKVDEEGGEEYEVSGEGRMCLPSMLIHPVKQIDLIIERAKEKIEEVSSPDE